MGAKTFAPQFRPQDFKGPLARHYPDREDLFQQLVGALLRELFLQRAFVFSTKGQDGGIDAFIEPGQDSAELFFNLRFPLILECKEHDDSLGNVMRNVEAGWASVRGKLTRQAELGWEGTYQPWRRAKGYLYIISAVLPHKQARDKLKQSIRDFFSSLPEEQKPCVENIHVLDWSDLAALLNGQTRLADAWLGTELTGIVGYETYEASLSGFRLYLKEEELSFIPPALYDAAHPENLLTSLEEKASASGLLLIGPGGVGKTRTCFEVARLAHRKGWRVLHILPGEPPVTASSLQEVVLQGRTPTLLSIDYLDQMGSLDFGTIRHRLLTEAQARGIPLALLANARPGLLHKPNSEREALFHRIDLDIRDRRDRITAHFQETIAPRASWILGPKRVQEICGTRPIIGMFIARELERIALEDKLDDTVVSQLRHGDLQGWIWRRFEEDGLVPQGTHPLLPAAPDPIMTAAAAGLAASPLMRPEMFGVISNTLAAAGMPEATATAGSLMDSLERSGWLEETGYSLSAPHDVIADELLEITICDRERHTVRSGIIDKVFMGARAMPRVLGRFSVALDRVIGQKDFPEQTLQRVKGAVSAWLESHAAEMGRAFTAANPDEVSYALGAVLTGAAWGDAALKAWEELIAPWLALNNQNAEARHLFYRGLKELPKGTAARLGGDALKWLEVHSLTLEASYILGPLIAREDLDKVKVQAAVSAVMEWLAQHKMTLEAGFVLPPLLAREDLGKIEAQAVVKAAVEWLARHKTAPEAEFVFNPLLTREDLDKGQAQEAIKAAMQWLAQHKTALEAGFVLPPLLGREDLSDGEAQAAVEAAMEWLAQHKTVLDAQFVLKPLLAREDLGTGEAEAAVEAAMEWLIQYKTALEAGFVLPPLLAREDLEKGEVQAAVKAAIEWLKDHFHTRDAEFVFKRLFGKGYLSADEKKRCLPLALERLNKVIETPEASFLLRWCLNERTMSEQGSTQAVELALKYLRFYASAPQIDFIFKRLLRNPNLDDNIWREAADYALAWLHRTPLASDRDHTLNSLLTRVFLLTPEEKVYLREDGHAWLQAFPYNKEKERIEANLKRL